MLKDWEVEIYVGSLGGGKTNMFNKILKEDIAKEIVLKANKCKGKGKGGRKGK